MIHVGVGEWAALATALLWTLSALAWTAAGRHVGALAVSFIRLVIASMFMTAYGGVWRGQWFPTDADVRTWLFLGVSGFFGFFLCDLCLCKAMLLIGPRLTLLLFSLSPPMAAAISWACGIDRLAPLGWTGMGITLAGVVWVVFEQPSHDEDRPDFRARTRGPGSQMELSPWASHRGRGVLLAVLAAASNAVGLVFAKEGIGQYDAVAATLIRASAALLGYLVLITLWRRWPAIRAATRHRKAMTQLTLGALVGPFVGVALSLVALRHSDVGVVATITATMPVLIIPFAILLFHEKVSPRAAIGAVIAVIGVALLMLPAS